MNQRRRTRVAIRKWSTVSWAGGECGGELENVSLKGCLIGSPKGDAAPVGEEVSIVIHLDPGSSDLDVRVQGRVVRNDSVGLALDFSEVEMESFRHLFRLVQYNASDPDSIEEELGSTAFIPPADESG